MEKNLNARATDLYNRLGGFGNEDARIVRALIERVQALESEINAMHTPKATKPAKPKPIKPKPEPMTKEQSRKANDLLFNAAFEMRDSTEGHDLAWPDYLGFVMEYIWRYYEKRLSTFETIEQAKQLIQEVMTKKPRKD